MNSAKYNIKCVKIDIGDAKLAVTHVTVGRMEYTVEEKQSMVKIEPMHTHSFYEIHVIEKGVCNMKGPNKDLILSGKQMVIVKPDELHVGVFSREQEFVRHVIHLKLEKRKGEEGYYDYLDSQLQNSSMKVFAVSEELLQMISWMESFRPTCMREACLEKIQISQLIGQIIDTISGLGQKPQEKMKMKLREQEQIETLLDTLVNLPISMNLQEIAQRTGYSVRQVSRMIQQKYGASYKKLRMTRKIAYAKKLLVEAPDLQVKEIIGKLDEKSVATFYRAFTKYVGCTPLEYRERYRHELENND